jgi:phosphate uptake regulator
MKRRLIKQKDSFTVTLPIKWVRDSNLKKNDEISLIQDENKLVIEPGEAKKTIKTAEIEVDLHHFNIYRSLIGGFYRGGYDEIKIKFKDRKVLPLLQKTVDFLHGLELLDIKENSCILKSVYKEEKPEILSHINKILNIIKTMQMIIVEDIENKNLNSKEELFQFRNQVLKQRDLIARIILQKRLLGAKQFPYHNLAFNLWQIARNYYNLYKTLSTPFKKSSIDFLKKTNTFFNDFFKSLQTHKLEDKHKAYDKLINEGISLMKNKPSLIVSYSMNILMMLQSCNSHVLMLNF